MSKRDESAFPGKDGAGYDTYGLTKLEYAAIHLCAGLMADSDMGYVDARKRAIEHAELLLDDLEQQGADEV